jgi:metal-responsive CopG/Arc/MetJ family transcriptional regulator
VAKVMISIPDALLERIDSRARAGRETRSGFLRRLAERELTAGEGHRRDEVVRLLDLATGSFGGDAATLIREDRRSH